MIKITSHHDCLLISYFFKNWAQIGNNVNVELKMLFNDSFIQTAHQYKAAWLNMQSIKKYTFTFIFQTKLQIFVYLDVNKLTTVCITTSNSHSQPNTSTTQLLDLFLGVINYHLSNYNAYVKKAYEIMYQERAKKQWNNNNTEHNHCNCPLSFWKYKTVWSSNTNFYLNCLAFGRSQFNHFSVGF